MKGGDDCAPPNAKRQAALRRLSQ